MRRGLGGGRTARMLLEDGRATLRDWRPPERPEPGPPAAMRVSRSPRAPEPVWGRTDAAGVLRRGVQRGLLFPALTLMGRPRVTGLHHLTELPGPVIIAPNHVSHADAPLVLQALPRRLRDRTLVPAAADYFFDRRWLSVAVTLAMNAVPFDRRQDIADSVRRCERFLRHGFSIILFPEGTRSSDGRLRGFKAGVAHLAVQTGAPLVPVYVQGTHALLGRGHALPRPTAVAVHFGPPLNASVGETARQVNERLETAVAALAESCRGYADRDAPPRRPGWREAWAEGRPVAPAVAAGDGGATPTWRERWRSTTPR